jgi:hypothetical protein
MLLVRNALNLKLVRYSVSYLDYIDATVLIEIAVNRMGNKVRLVSNIGSFSIYELPKYALFIRIRLGLGV